MGFDPITIGVIGLGISAGSAVMSYSQQEKAQEKQEEQAAAQRRLMELRQQREKRDAIRQARILRGQAVNKAADGGVQQSSGLEGAVASIGTQLGSNISFLDSQAAISDDITALGAQAAAYQSSAGLFSGLSNLGFQIAGSNLFKEETPVDKVNTSAKATSSYNTPTSATNPMLNSNIDNAMSGYPRWF